MYVLLGLALRSLVAKAPQRYSSFSRTTAYNAIIETYSPICLT